MVGLGGQETFWWTRYYHTFGDTAFHYVRRLLKMAGAGKKFDFHGSFTSKVEAVKKEKETSGSFVRERRVNGKVRYFVLTERK